MVKINEIYQGDCIEIMKLIDDGAIDMILCDLPYGSTSCKWDILIPFISLWEQYERIIKKGGPIVLTAREPFTSMLVTSNIKLYKHKLIWNKKQSGSFQNAKHMPLQIEEDILVFSKGKANYYPIMRKGKMRKRGGAKEKSRVVGGGLKDNYENYSDLYYPTNIIELANPRKNKLHPTEKPAALFEHLIKLYSKEGNLVLDNCSGSGTTGIACLNTNREYILIEKEQIYVDMTKNRIKEKEKNGELYKYFGG